MELISCVLAFVVSLAAADVNAMHMSRSAHEDQAASSSGYVYHTDSNGPTSYMQFNTATGNAGKFGYPPISLGHYAEAPLPYLHYPHSPQLLKPIVNQDKYGEDYANEHGKKYEQQLQSSKGEKGGSGYEKQQSHEEGAKGEHEKEGQAGYYNTEGGNKKGDHEEASHHAAAHEASKGETGGSSSEGSSHKKGSKTTGYHKVHHKEEYKKDHTFYDESDSKGHYDKYGKAHAEHASEKGGHRKGGRVHAAHQAGQFGKKGYYDKGHHHSNDRGYKGEEGDRKYYNKHSDYAKNGGDEHGESYGHEESDEKY